MRCARACAAANQTYRRRAASSLTHVAVEAVLGFKMWADEPDHSRRVRHSAAHRDDRRNADVVYKGPI